MRDPANATDASSVRHRSETAVVLWIGHDHTMPAALRKRQRCHRRVRGQLDHARSRARPARRSGSSQLQPSSQYGFVQREVDLHYRPQ
jgi:hypothetical protein